VRAVYLLDVNLLVALLWPQHTFHDVAQAWFQIKGRHGWRESRIRNDSNKTNLSDWAGNMSHPHHRFWPDSLGFGEAAALFNAQMVGHQQIIDAYLLGLAFHNDGKLVTFDRSMTALLPTPSPRAHTIECIGG
jgi:predicted nucleic acid-binding protein